MSETPSGLVLSVTRGALMVRLLSLLVSTLSIPLLPMQWRGMGAILLTLIAASSYLLLIGAKRQTSVVWRRRLIMLDALAMAWSTVAMGGEHLLVLGNVTTCLLAGLWLSWSRAAVCLSMVLVGHVTGTVVQTAGLGQDPLRWSFVPCMLAVMVIFGRLVAQAAESESAALASARESVCLAAQAEAQAALAREMHDSLAKSLQGLSLGAQALPCLIAEAPDRADAEARLLALAASQAVRESRQLMSGLRSEAPREPLPVMVRQAVRAWEVRTGRQAAVHIDGQADVREPNRRYDLLAALEEALENIDRHTPLGTRVTVSLGPSADGVNLTVRDHGQGVAAEVLRRAQENGHFGVVGMDERLRRIGGRLTWNSTVGRGTSVGFSLPARDLAER